jgi:hypothetical protein
LFPDTRLSGILLAQCIVFLSNACRIYFFAKIHLFLLQIKFSPCQGLQGQGRGGVRRGESCTRPRIRPTGFIRDKQSGINKVFQRRLLFPDTRLSTILLAQYIVFLSNAYRFVNFAPSFAPFALKIQNSNTKNTSY